MLELVDLLGEYPDQDDPQIQTLVTGKKEFSDLRTGRSEPTPQSQGKLYYNHQELFIRLATVYDTLFLIAAAGTGKSCCFIGLREKCKESPELSHITQAYVFSGKQQLEDFKRQVMYNCTGGKYLTEHIKSNIGERKLKTAISRAVGKWYNTTTYKKSQKKIERDIDALSKDVHEANRRISEQYSGSAFFLDEIQFIKIPTERAKQKWEERRVKDYAYMWRILKLVKRSKVVIATATPIINSPEELIYWINLLNPLNNQIKD